MKITVSQAEKMTDTEVRALTDEQLVCAPKDLLVRALGLRGQEVRTLEANQKGPKKVPGVRRIANFVPKGESGPGYPMVQIIGASATLKTSDRKLAATVDAIEALGGVEAARKWMKDNPAAQ